MLILCDEVIGFLKSLDREGHEADRAFYLTAWNGNSRYTYDRIGRGTVDIEAAIVSFVGAIQPGVLHDYLRHAVAGGAGDDGLVQRFQMSVYPDMPGEWHNVDRPPAIDARNAAYDALRRLDELVPGAVGEPDPHDPNGLPFLRFDEKAQRVFDAWRECLENRIRGDVEHPAMEAHLAKYRSLAPALALIIHLTEGGRGPVTASAAKRATQWADYLESHARRIYAGVTEAPAVAARSLARRILNVELEDGFTARDVYGRCWSGLDRDQTQAAIDVLLALHWIEERVEPTAGKPRVRYFINPKLQVGQKSALTELTKAPSVSSVSAPDQAGAEVDVDAPVALADAVVQLADERERGEV